MSWIKRNYENLFKKKSPLFIRKKDKKLLMFVPENDEPAAPISTW